MKHLRKDENSLFSGYEEYLRAFTSRLDRGDWRGAGDLARQRFERNKTPGSLVHLCDALLAGDDHSRFEAHLQRLISMDGDPTEVLRLRALYAAATGKHGSAISLWLQYSDLKPGKPAPLLNAANLCLEHTRLARLTPILDRLRRKWPDHPERRTLEGRYDALLRAEPEAALKQRTQTLTEARQWEEAREAWELLFAVTPRKPGLLIRICDCLLEQGNFIECCETVTLYLDDLKGSSRFQDTCRRMLVGLSKADEVLVVGESLLAEISPPVLLAALHVALGRSPSEGAEVLAGRLERWGDPEFLREAARELMLKDHLDVAQRFVDAAVASIPDDVELVSVALGLAWKQGDLVECRSHLDRLRTAASAIASSIETFEPYLIAHYNIIGADTFLAEVALAATSARKAASEAALFDLVDRLHVAGERGPLAFLLREAPVVEPATRACLDMLGSVFLDGADDDRRIFDRFAGDFSRWAASDQRRFSRIAEVLFEHERLSLLELMLKCSPPEDQEDLRLLRVRAQLAQRSGRWEEAAAFWSRFLDANPNDGWARINWTAAVIRGGDPVAGRAAFEDLHASKDMRRGPFRSELVPLALRLGDLETAKRLALDVLDNAAAHDLRPHQRHQLARALSLVGMPELAWPLYGLKKLPNTLGASRLAVILDPGLTRTSGHHVNYNVFAWRLMSSLAGDGAPLTPLVLCREAVDDTPELRDARIVPALNFEPYAFDDLPVVHQCLGGLNSSFYYDLSKLELQDQVGFVFMHSMRATMVEGFSRWIEEVFRTSKGYVVVGLIEVDHIMQAEEIVQSFVEIYRSALRRLKGIRNIGLLLYVETESGKRFLEDLGIEGLEVMIFPYLAASLCLHYRQDLSDDKSDVLRVGMVGGTGDRRGSHLIPKLVAKTEDLAPHLRWKLQLNMMLLRGIMRREDAHYSNKLYEYSHVDIADRVLSLEEYFEFMDECDVIILPYQERYAVSGSGVLYESIYMGKFLIVPRETFMPAVLAELKHPHLVIEEASDSYLECAVRDVVANRARIRRQLSALRRSRPRRLPSDEFQELVARGVQAQLETAVVGVSEMS